MGHAEIFLSRAHEIASRGNEMLSRYHEIASRGNEILSRAHEINFFSACSFAGSVCNLP